MTEKGVQTVPLFKTQVDYFLHRLHISDRNRTVLDGGFQQVTFQGFTILLILRAGLLLRSPATTSLPCRSVGAQFRRAIASVRGLPKVDVFNLIKELRWLVQINCGGSPHLFRVGTMKSSEFKRYLASKGVKFVEAAKHTKLYLDGRQSLLPRHSKEIGEGLRRAVLRQLQIKD